MTLESQILTKQACLETLDNKIKSLKDFVTPVQLTIWRRSRKKLFRELKQLKINYDLTQK